MSAYTTVSVYGLEAAKNATLGDCILAYSKYKSKYGIRVGPRAEELDAATKAVTDMKASMAYYRGWLATHKPLKLAEVNTARDGTVPNFQAAVERIAQACKNTPDDNSSAFNTNMFVEDTQRTFVIQTYDCGKPGINTWSWEKYVKSIQDDNVDKPRVINPVPEVLPVPPAPPMYAEVPKPEDYGLNEDDLTNPYITDAMYRDRSFDDDTLYNDLDIDDSKSGDDISKKIEAIKKFRDVYDKYYEDLDYSDEYKAYLMSDEYKTYEDSFNAAEVVKKANRKLYKDQTSLALDGVNYVVRLVELQTPPPKSAQDIVNQRNSEIADVKKSLKDKEGEYNELVRTYIAWKASEIGSVQEGLDLQAPIPYPSLNGSKLDQGYFKADSSDTSHGVIDVAIWKCYENWGASTFGTLAMAREYAEWRYDVTPKSSDAPVMTARQFVDVLKKRADLLWFWNDPLQKTIAVPLMTVKGITEPSHIVEAQITTRVSTYDKYGRPCVKDGYAYVRFEYKKYVWLSYSSTDQSRGSWESQSWGLGADDLYAGKGRDGGHHAGTSNRQTGTN
ncbi:hypothetical protein IWW38_002420 [Coemansia aciculifera]|uniref:Uncharacterized protein n=1 Tax=Coemansia aciculifera TaxID=417176 RepID=A0ACC1M3L0_9FUNG|nr:hypothetical protein IWW38_002420 [Coemansia aciculifera]